MKKIFKPLLIVAACLVALIVIVKLSSSKSDFHKKYDGIDLTSDIGNIERKNTSRSYLAAHADSAHPTESVLVDVTAFDAGASNGVFIEENVDGVPKCIRTEDSSSATWKISVTAEGMYNIMFDYKAVASRNINMERALYINGVLPFDGADTMVFTRLWHDGTEIKYDNQGNAIRPSQAEYFAWQKAYCRSDLGYEVEPYQFFFLKGENTITLVANNEPMLLRGISIIPVAKTSSYEQYLASNPKDTFADDVSTVKIQGESSTLRSDPSLFARYDRASAFTEPYSVSKTVLNYIGGDSWKSSGQWIEWQFDAPSEGYYTIAVKGRQLYQRGAGSCRSLYSDGAIPFDGVESIQFIYATDWQQQVLSDNSGNPYYFYFSKGMHAIRLEATLGGMSPIINELEDSIYRLNIIYRTILVLTGVSPDQSRDYNIDQVYPDAVKAMNLESKRLYKIVDEFVDYTGQKSDKIAPAQTLAIQLEEFYDNPYKITKQFTTFKDNITSLGTSLLSLSESKLDVDYITIAGKNASVSKTHSGFFKKIGHSMRSFFSSFFTDSTALGNVYAKGDKDVITIWIVTGRDQSQVLKNMIDDSFTPNSDVKVNLKLVSIDSLLSAVVAGNGPDVVLSIDASKPVDYAMRNANENLRQFPDCDEVLSQFYHSAYQEYEYNGGVYALPETETFNLLFYRKDILEQLGLSVPNTWDDLIAMLPTLQGNNLQVGIPYPTIQNPNMNVFYSLVYQNGGTIYNEAGNRSALDNESGIAAFTLYTSLFNNYGLPPDFDFANRFRSGLMPLGIADYTTYNTLAVAAPEIRGLWDFALIPGTLRVKDDGTPYVDRTTNGSGVNCMMIKAKSEAKKQASWKFMKWWVSTETQVRFGREMEALLGASARYATANVNALKQLSWSTRQLSVLTTSLDSSIGIPEVPGSYYTRRHVSTAIRKVINEKDDAREVMIDYARKINEELTKKRKEFGLPTYEDSLKSGGDQ